MKKRLVTTVFVCALSVACAFAACNDDELPATDLPVSAEEWVAAFENTENAANMTYTEDLELEYREEEGVVDHEKFIYKFTDGITMCDCTETFGEHVYRSTVYGITENSKTVWVSSTEDGWEKNNGLTKFDYYFTGMRFAKSPDSEEFFAVKELYSSFVYADGEYTATLYGGKNEVAVNVKIADGYVKQFSYEFSTAEGITSRLSLSYVFSDYGTTEITVPPEVREAVNMLKEDN